MDIISAFFRDTAVFVNDHALLIKGVTALVALFFATAILLLRNEALSAERWAKYFGFAFLVFSIQYIVQFFGGYLEFHNVPVHYAMRAFVVICSNLNNLFFLAAALELLDSKPVFPGWALLLATIALVGILDDRVWWWSRIPDGLFSAVCIGLIGYGTFTNISFRRRGIFAALAGAVAGLYAIVQIAFGLNPLLAQYHWWKLSDAIAYLAGSTDPKTKLGFLDALDIAAVLPLKFGLFFSALFLLMRAIVVVSSNNARKMMTRITEGRLEYLTSEGIVKSIGESVGADVVELFLKLPGLQNRRMAVFKWDHAVTPNAEPQITSLPSGVETAEGLILLEGEPESAQRDGNGRSQSASTYNVNRNPDHSISYLANNQAKVSLVAVPIHFHGAAIGCVKVQWMATRAFSATAVQHIRELADLVAPAAQSYRELAALDQFSYRFSRLQVRQPIGDSEESAALVNEVLHDVLSPLATSISVNIGFRSFQAFCGEDNRYVNSLRKLTSGHSGEALALQLETSSSGALDILSSDLVVVIHKRQHLTRHQLGELKVAVSSGKDEMGHPTLARNYLYRRTVAALAADALLDSAREYLGSTLKDFGVRLNRRPASNVSAWFEDVEETAKMAGLLWAVATQPDNDELLGTPEAVAIVQNLPRSQGRTQEETYHIEVRHEKDLPVIEICLLDAGARIWLGVGQKTFGQELNFPSPWRIFLEHFAEIANSALVRLTAARDLQRLQIEAAQSQGLATVAVTTGTLIHQLINIADDLSNPARALVDALHVGELKCGERLGRLIETFSESTFRLWEFTSALMNVTKLDEHRPCILLKAAEESKKLFAVSLNQREIQLEVSVDAELVVDVPFHIATLALANLVNNAKDAINNCGSIRIEAEDMGDMVYCHVTDDGPGVPPGIRSKIFDLGITTKPGSGGWGLYLVARSLRENRGHIALANPGPNGTKFTIRFPKSRQEELI